MITNLLQHIAPGDKFMSVHMAAESYAGCTHDYSDLCIIT
jgi:hypothetical protein